MFRARRYRVSLALAAIFVLIIYYFIRSRNTLANPSFPQPVDHSESFPQSPPSLTPPDFPPSHSFSPESSPLQESEIHGSLGATTSAQDAPFDNTNNEAASSFVPIIDEAEISPTSHEEIKEVENGSNFPKPKFSSYDKGQLEVDTTKTSQPPSHGKQMPERFPLAPEEIIKLPTGTAKTLQKVQADFKDESSTSKMRRVQRLSTIKEAFEHAWNGYKAFAMGHDELKPVRGGYNDRFNGWGATLVDSLDTLWIMDLKEEFAIAVDEVKKIDFTTSSKDDIPVFETVIRYLGGLLGAYDISRHKYNVLLDKAIELAEVLISAFDTPNRMPRLFYKWGPEHASEPLIGSKETVLAEIGSLSMEFTRLAQLTRNNKYYDAIARITNELEKFQSQTKLPGLWPVKLDASGCRKISSQLNQEIARGDVPNTPTSTQESTQISTPTSTWAAKPSSTDIESYTKFLERRELSGLSEDAEPANYDEMSNGISGSETQGGSALSDQDCTGGLNNRPGEDQFSLAALADSTYEYLPKEYMLLGGLNEQYRTMYEKAMNVVREHLLFRPMVKDDRDIRFVGTLSLSQPIAAQSPASNAMVYEATHLACFAGGMFALGAKLFEIDGDLDLAAKLTEGCIWAYESTKTGIMPDNFLLHPCKKGNPCVWNETEYRNALDPKAATRMPRMEQKARSGSKKTQNSINKYSSEPDQGHIIAVPATKAGETDINNNKGIEGRDVADSKALAYEKYVTSRIRNERLPPGMTRILNRGYLLRPEAIESVFYMFRITGDDYWRERGWQMFEAISKYTYTGLAHSAIKDVTITTPQMQDQMESFWLAETLKYFYLLFSEPNVVSLDQYILNTEAHPFKRPEY